MNYLLKLISIVCLPLLMITHGLQAGEIHDAIAAGDLNKVKALIEADSTLLESKEGQLGHTPLFHACVLGQFEIANFLIDKGANTNVRDKYRFPLLSFAIQYGFPKSKVNNKGENECILLIQRLIDMGSDININHEQIGAPIHVAASIGNLELVKLLIDNGANLNATSRHGTPVQCSLYKNEEMAVFLVKNGAKQQEFSFGMNDLHLAAIEGRANLIQAMVDVGADLNTPDDYGHTPLYYATMHGHRRAADLLIAAGANKSTIVETNYKKAPQLTKKLKKGESYLWYMGGTPPGTGYVVKTKNNLLIFDPYKIAESQEDGLANGKLDLKELEGQKITILCTRKEIWTVDHSKQFPGAEYVLSYDPTAKVQRRSSLYSPNPTTDKKDSSAIQAYHLATANESFSMNGMQIRTIQTRASNFNGLGNLGYLVEVDGVNVFHAGLLSSNNSAPEIEKFRKEVNFLTPFGSIDFAILPVNGRHIGSIDYEQYLYLIDQLKPKAIYLIGDDMVYEEHLKCLKVLKKRDVPVFYPDGGIAKGQRFHYIREQIQK